MTTSCDAPGGHLIGSNDRCALGYVLGKFPELSKVIIDEIALHYRIAGGTDG